MFIKLFQIKPLQQILKLRIIAFHYSVFMKKYFLLLIPFIFPVFIFAQKLEENKIDPMTNLLMKHTSWEKFTLGGEFNSYFRISQIDSSYFFDIRIILTDYKPLDIKSGQELVFTLSNAETVTLTNFKTTQSCKGCGAVALAGSNSPGIQVSYILNKEQLEKLRYNVLLTKEQYEKHKKKVIEHIKIDTNSGSIEHNLSEFSYLQIRKAIRLVKK